MGFNSVFKGLICFLLTQKSVWILLKINFHAFYAFWSYLIFYILFPVFYTFFEWNRRFTLEMFSDVRIGLSVPSRLYCDVSLPSQICLWDPLLEICHETHCAFTRNGTCERFGLLLCVLVIYLKINPSLTILMLHNNWSYWENEC